LKNENKFKDYVSNYIKLFELNDWTVSVDNTDDDSVYACTYFNDDDETMNSSRSAIISFNKNWIKTANDLEIEKTALHEVLEVYYSDIRIWLTNRAVLPDFIIDGKIHSYIHLFENKILPFLKEKNENDK